MRAFLLLSLLLGLAACPPVRNGDDDDSAGDDDDATTDDDDAAPDCPAELQDALEGLPLWTVQHSCSAAFFSTGTGDATTRLGVQFELWNMPAVAAGDTYMLVLDGSFEPKNGAPGSVEVQRGSNLFEYDCNDAISVEPVVTLQAVGVEGTVLLEVTEFNDEWWWSGDVTLSGVVVEGEDGVRCAVPDRTWTGLSFGWLPG
jgi:hypothetical protein